MGMLLQVAAHGQQAESFSVATMNVDGLPQKIIIFKVNVDGPGADGSSRIGKYIARKGYDIVCMQEDFNFHDVMLPWLEDDYQVDSCSDRVDYDVKDANIDLRYPQNIKFKTDGLTCARKNGITVDAVERVAWKRSFGKFSHSFDDIVTKGYRRYELRLPSGTALTLYNMHMDASSGADEKVGLDSMDRAVRLEQWIQLRDDVLAHLDKQPVVVVGDVNSLYRRDKVKAEFIDAIEASGKGKVVDAWVEKAMNGKYPAYAGGIVSTDDSTLVGGETLDKILYINPTGGTQIKLLTCQLDTTDYRHNGQPLGDHYPLVATFSMDRKSTAITTAVVDEAVEAATYYNLSGQRIARPADGIYIERRGNNTVKKMKR